MKTEVVVLILFFHWIADFVLQTDEMAKGKSTNNICLTKHVGAYSSFMMLLAVFILPVKLGLFWAICNGVIHWVQDYWTSRINSNLWLQGKRHAFFVAMGADQFIHYTFLLSTYHLLNL